MPKYDFTDSFSVSTLPQYGENFITYASKIIIIVMKFWLNILLRYHHQPVVMKSIFPDMYLSIKYLFIYLLNSNMTQIP